MNRWLNIVVFYLIFFKILFIFIVFAIYHICYWEKADPTGSLKVQTECLKLSFSGDNTIHKYPCYKVGLEFGSHDATQWCFYQLVVKMGLPQLKEIATSTEAVFDIGSCDHYQNPYMCVHEQSKDHISLIKQA